MLKAFGLKKESKKDVKALFQAIKKIHTQADIKKLRTLFNAQPDLDLSATDDNGDTLLHLVAAKGLYKVAEVLIRKSSSSSSSLNINAVNKNGDTPLHLAVQRDNDENTRMVSLLLANHANVEARNQEGIIPLHYAAMSGNTRAFSELSSYRYDSRNKVLVVDPDRSTIYAKNDNNVTPLQWAGCYFRKDIIELFSKPDKEDVHEGDIVALFKAIEKAQTEADIKKLCALIDAHPDIDHSARDDKGNTLLHLAAARGIYKVACALIRKMIRSNSLLDINAVNNCGDTPLHLVVQRDTDEHKRIMGLLLTNQANVEVKNQEGAIPLHYAARMGDTRVFSELSSYRYDSQHKVLIADENRPTMYAKDNNNATPLQWAACSGQTDIVESFGSPEEKVHERQVFKA